MLRQHSAFMQATDNLCLHLPPPNLILLHWTNLEHFRTRTSGMTSTLLASHVRQRSTLTPCRIQNPTFHAKDWIRTVLHLILEMQMLQMSQGQVQLKRDHGMDRPVHRRGPLVLCQLPWLHPKSSTNAQVQVPFESPVVKGGRVF